MAKNPKYGIGCQRPILGELQERRNNLRLAVGVSSQGLLGALALTYHTASESTPESSLAPVVIGAAFSVISGTVLLHSGVSLRIANLEIADLEAGVVAPEDRVGFGQQREA